MVCAVNERCLTLRIYFHAFLTSSCFQGDDEKDISPSYWAIKWRNNDKMIFFTLFFLIWWYDDITATVEGRGWSCLPVWLSIFVEYEKEPALNSSCKYFLMKSRSWWNHFCIFYSLLENLRTYIRNSIHKGQNLGVENSFIYFTML